MKLYFQTLAEKNFAASGEFHHFDLYKVGEKWCLCATVGGIRLVYEHDFQEFEDAKKAAQRIEDGGLDGCVKTFYHPAPPLTDADWKDPDEAPRGRGWSWGDGSERPKTYLHVPAHEFPTEQAALDAAAVIKQVIAHFGGKI